MNALVFIAFQENWENSMKSSCIEHPSREPILVIRKWMTEFCEGNSCAACLLSFFIYFHEVKSEMRDKNKRLNNIAEQHGENRVNDETLIQFHSQEELQERCLGFFSINTIRKGLKALIALKVLEVVDNPNPKHKYDRTTYYLFKPSICNDWIQNKYCKSVETSPLNENKSAIFPNLASDVSIQDTSDCSFKLSGIDNSDLRDRNSKDDPPYSKIKEPIPKITIQDNQLIDISAKQFETETINYIDSEIYLVLKKAGINDVYFQSNNGNKALQIFLSLKPSITEVESAIDRALNFQPSGFKLPYLTKIIVNDRKYTSNKTKAGSPYKACKVKPKKISKYKRDLSNASWAVKENENVH